MHKKTMVSWSSGKDSAWALHVLRQDPSINVVGLFCTATEIFQRVSMHGVKLDLVKEQAKCVNLPLHIIHIPFPCTNDLYEKIMADFVRRAREEDNIKCFAFGDLFLESVRRYREDRLLGTQITPIFPLWGIPTRELAHHMICDGLKARIVCLDPKYLSANFAGRKFDRSFLAEKPDAVDFCGENGEFHTFVTDGPMFHRPIHVEVGNTIIQDGFHFTDLNLASTDLRA